MRQDPTSTPRKNPPATGIGFLGLFAVLCVALCGMLAAFYPWSEDTPADASPTPWGEISDAPAVFTPEPTKGLRLEVNPPAPLTDEQRYYLHMVQALPRLPIAFGLDKPPIGFTDDEAHIFTALIISESMLRPFDEYGNQIQSEIGCIGLAQLCFSLDTPETRESIPANIYAGAAFFKSLLDDHGGDFEAALSAYKGQTTATTQWQTDTVFRYVKLVGGK